MGSSGGAILTDTPKPIWAEDAAEIASKTSANNNERIDKTKRILLLSA
jgi:hypothetical protein